MFLQNGKKEKESRCGGEPRHCRHVCLPPGVERQVLSLRQEAAPHLLLGIWGACVVLSGCELSSASLGDSFCLQIPQDARWCAGGSQKRRWSPPLPPGHILPTCLLVHFNEVVQSDWYQESLGWNGWGRSRSLVAELNQQSLPPEQCRSWGAAEGHLSWGDEGLSSSGLPTEPALLRAVLRAGYHLAMGRSQCTWPGPSAPSSLPPD